jgi:hypothetical protein
MKIAIKLIVLTILVITILSVYFEYIINRPLNFYLQTALSIIVIIGTIFYLVYLIKSLIKILNPNP